MLAPDLSPILQSSPHVAAFERFVTASKRPEGPRDYLFLDKKPRFEPRREDVVVPLPGLVVRERGGAVRLVSEAPRAEVVIPGASRREVERVLAALDGDKLLAEVGWEVDRAALATVLRHAFGLVLFAPAAVSALESRLTGASIVRFPASPYAVERVYWENMADVREAFAARADHVSEHAGFVRLLRELHVTALMGRGLDRFYKPASPASDDGAAPGHFWTAESRVVDTTRGTVFLDGPRVLAPEVGGSRFFARLAASVGDPDATLPARGSSSGRVVTARGERDEAPKTWFLPARPLDDDHLEALRAPLAEALVAAREPHADRAARAAGRFHYRYVRTHPFRCANQSVAMTIVNEVLQRAGLAPIPHLALDHFALRLTEAAYEALFARAVERFGAPGGSPAARLAVLAQKTTTALAFMDAFSAAPTDAAADALLASSPEAAVLALLEDGAR